MKPDSLPYVRAIFSLLLLAGVLSPCLATPLPPSQFCIEGTGCAEDGGSYTLRSIGEIPFAYNLPVPPTITSDVTVTPQTLSANKVNGRRLILSPGYYGDQVFNTQDQEIVFTPGAEFGFLSIGASAARLVFRGEPARAGLMRYISTPFSGGPTDILFDGITQDHASRQWNQGNMLQGERLAIINSSLRAEDYVLASFPSTVGGRLIDGIFANNSFHSYGMNQSAVRFTGSLRLVFVDNRILKTGSGHHSFRLHTSGSLETDYVFAARNQIEGPGMQMRPSGGDLGAVSAAMLNVWFEDNDFYRTENDFLNIGTATNNDYPQILRLLNNRAFSNAGSWPGQVYPAWTVSNNSTVAYQEPPDWEFQ